MLAPVVRAVPMIQRSPVQALPFSHRLQLLNALGLKGLDAITYLHDCQQVSCRPTVATLLRRLPVEGMNT